MTAIQTGPHGDDGTCEARLVRVLEAAICGTSQEELQQSLEDHIGIRDYGRRQLVLCLDVRNRVALQGPTGVVE